MGAPHTLPTTNGDMESDHRTVYDPLPLRDGIHEVILPLVMNILFTYQLITKPFGYKKGQNDQLERGRPSVLKE
jgi:hypothetical protein